MYIILYEYNILFIVKDMVIIFVSDYSLLIKCMLIFIFGIMLSILLDNNIK